MAVPDIEFDWYQATTRAGLDDVLECLSDLEQGAKLVHGRGHHGYAYAAQLHGSAGLLATVWHGGSHQYPHAVITGETAPAGAALIRASFADRHVVTRADSRVDYSGADTFDRFQPLLVDAADRFRVKLDMRGDHLLTREGRSLFLGAASSMVRLRLYDKAAELRAKFAQDPVRLARIPEFATRFEAQVRPATRQARERFATMQPVEVMGASPWLRHVFLAVAGMEVEPVQVGKAWRQADDERAYSAMLAQYGGLLGRMLQSHGSPECVGLQLFHDLGERARAKREA